jgi:hypothetical protein
MSLAKTQTALVCLVIAAVPLAWQARTQAQLVSEQAKLQAEAASSRQSVEELDQQVERSSHALERAQEESRRAEALLNALSARRAKQGLAQKYQWDDSSPVLRVPKAFLAQMDVGGLNGFNNQLNPAIKTLLQLTPKESEQTQAAVDRFLADYHAAQARTLRPVQAVAKDLKWRPGKEPRVFDVPALGDEFTAMRQTFFDELQYIMGDGRFALFKKSLQWWMPVDDERGSVSSAQPVVNSDRRVRFYQPSPGDSYLNWDFDMPGSYTSGTLMLDEIPPPFQPYLKDWIELARTQQAPRRDTQNAPRPVVEIEPATR